MNQDSTPPEQASLNAQRAQWERTFSTKPTMFGDKPSAAALGAATLFREAGVKRLLELGAGTGRDSLYFAQQGFELTAVEYAVAGIDAIVRRATSAGLSHALSPVCHDVREELPFADQSFDACYSHMLLCMALTTAELQRLARSIQRVLKAGAIMLYTARTVSDPQYGTGAHRGEQLYEIEGGYIVHFFDDEMIQRLSAGYETPSVQEFEEGRKRLVRVAQRKKPS